MKWIQIQFTNVRVFFIVYHHSFLTQIHNSIILVTAFFKRVFVYVRCLSKYADEGAEKKKKKNSVGFHIADHHHGWESHGYEVSTVWDRQHLLARFTRRCEPPRGQNWSWDVKVLKKKGILVCFFASLIECSTQDWNHPGSFNCLPNVTKSETSPRWHHHYPPQH